MKAFFFLEVDSKVYLLREKLGKTVDILQWNVSEDTMGLFTPMFLLLSSIIKSKAKIFD